MFCSISGEVPQEPVVSRLSGHLYERRLIHKHLQETQAPHGQEGVGTCPMTGEPLSRDTDLVALQANKAVKPRAVGASSVPGMLALFQNEWDELMLETFTLKQHLDSTRQELSQALYQHDAACRVIARLMRERDEARSMLASLAAQGVTVDGSGQLPPAPTQQQEAPSGGMDVEQEDQEGQLSATVLAVLGDTCAALSKGRKGRKASPEQATREQLTAGCGASPTLSVTPHATAKPGVTCLALSQAGPGDQGVALTGGADKMAFLTELGGGKVLAKLSGHAKKVTAVALHAGSGASPVAFTASADNSVKVWAAGEGGSYNEAVSFADQHSGEIHGLCAHPSGDFLLGVSADNSWSFMDVSRGSSVLSVANTHADEHFSAGELHPDGLILACGASSGAVRLWDIREQKNVASLGEEGGHAKGVSCLSFNQNGYLLASGGAEGSCKVWDLRKLKSVASLDSSSNKAVTSVAFDPAGMYLALGSAAGTVDLSVSKEWACLSTLSTHKKAVTGLAWGADAAFLLSSSMDRCIKKQSFLD
mmetsp:Transcript_15753/g.26301  ORF Transcript_15753/g.26301 Transcript_15753/m.26301 type:complete len:535 (-) Transcript_15753:71-1675(-)